MAIMDGKTPVPEDYPELPAADPLWDIMRQCWTRDPAGRPTMAQTLDKLRGLAEVKKEDVTGAEGKA
ncbi:hypothetical protein FRB90_010075 [Tulasnella sp. 427]|nr:hypothetical protein FRB90_010075 [Tulasnella sp. 427]